MMFTAPQVFYDNGASHLAKAMASFLSAPCFCQKSIIINRTKVRLKKGVLILHDGKVSYIDLRDAYYADENFKTVLSLPNINAILKCQFRPGVIDSNKVLPYTYFVKDMDIYGSHLKELRKRPKKNKALFFKGTVIAKRRLILKWLIKQAVCVDVNRTLSIADYYQKCSNYKVGLSLPGHGNVCYREIEYFGLGVVAIMPQLLNTMHDPLIPDVHYISVRNRLFHSKKKDLELTIANDIILRYKECLSNEKLLKTISHNAKEWFDRNVRFPASCELACRLLKL